jgi:hypothetical protein
MRLTTSILTTAIALGASATASAQTPRWVPMDVPAWSAAGMADESDQIRRGSVITSWFRFVDAPGRPPAEDDPEVVDAMRDGGHVDLRASLDCGRRRFRVEGTRIVDADGTVVDVGYVPADRAIWVPLGTRTRASAVYAALCRPRHG